MTKHLLLFGLLAMLLVVSCKKNNAPDPTVTTPTDPVKTTKPIVVTDLPKLINLRINGAECAFDSISNSYYFPVATGTSLSTYTVGYDSTAATAIFINSNRLNSGGSITYPLTGNQTVEVRVINSLNTTIIYNLIITNLPMVILHTKYTSDFIGEDQVSAAMHLVNPDHDTEKTPLQLSTNISIAIRGVTARNLPKKSYTVHTVDASGENADVSLLGLRNDEDWILDAMYIDQARMRNRLCTDIWNSFNNVPYIASEPTAINGTRGYMTEVFLNNKYHGLYCLTEKLDRKQLQVKKQYGAVYKSDESTNESNFYYTSVFFNSSATWAGWELSYPDLDDTPAPNWGYLSNVTNFIGTSTDEDFSNNITKNVDINNIADYFIFMNMVNATDNQAKNTFFSFYDYRNAGAFFYSPWDLDGSMGRDWGGLIVPNTLIGAGTNNLFIRLLKLDAGNFRELLKSRWNGLKGNQLSKAAVGARIEAYRKLLNNSNAFGREYGYASNIDQNLDVETTYMTTWYAAQYDLFDSYINNL